MGVRGAGARARGRAGAGGGTRTGAVPAGLLDPTGQGRDSLGRGLDEGSIVAAVMGSGAVLWEREALEHYLPRRAGTP